MKFDKQEIYMCKVDRTRDRKEMKFDKQEIYRCKVDITRDRKRHEV